MSRSPSHSRTRYPRECSQGRSNGILLTASVVCLGCVFILVGCSDKKKPAERKASPASVAREQDQAALPGTVETAPAQSIALAGASKQTPQAWSDRVKSQWKQVAAAFVRSDVSDAMLQAALADVIEMTPVEPHGETEHRGEAVHVQELTLPTAKPMVRVAANAFVATMRELLFVRPGAADDQVHFKLFGISREGTRLKTRQRLTALGARDGNPVRSYAVVDATWEVSDDPQSLRLSAFSMSKLVRADRPENPDGLAGGLAMFEDIAANVLGRNQAWSQQLEPGMNTWARNIDRTLNPDFLGYHGLAIRDVNGDGWEDVFLCQPGGLPNLLFQQQADGTFVDRSHEAGVDWLDNSTGALLVDLDNDGDADLAVATQRAFLVMENDGAGKFVLRAQLPHVAKGYSPTAVDYDLDGDLDLLVLRYTATNGKTGDFPTPHPFHDARNGGANVMLQNQGAFRFQDVTAACGLGVDNHRFSFAASWEDYDNDGDQDLYIANDFGPNQLFRNDGSRIVDASVVSGSQDWGFGMSATWADYDRDGHVDLYVSSMFSGAGNQVVAQADFNASMPEATRQKYMKMVRGNTLLRNVGEGRFLDVTNPVTEGFAGWAWGAQFVDFDNDGWQDLYVANGYISQPDKDDL